MNETIETEKWNIYPKKSSHQGIDDSYIEIIFRPKSDLSGVCPIKKEELEKLEMDLRDLGKWRKFRELKKELGK